MSIPFTSRRGRRAGAALLLASLAFGPAVFAAPSLAGRSQDRVDVAALLENAPSGDLAGFEAALPRVKDPAGAALLHAQIAALRLDSAGVAKALADFAAAPGATPALRAAALGIEADMAFTDGDYARAADAMRRLQPLLAAMGSADRAETNAQTLSVAAALAGQPRQSVAGGTPETIPTARDKAGLVRAEVTVNGIGQDAVFDTGANLSVVNVSTAKRLGLRMLDGTASVGSTGSADVTTRLAVADRLVIAGVELRNVAFLVMDDAKLDFPIPGGYRIDAIIGFPVFRALGRVQFARDGHFTAGGKASRHDDNLRSSGNDLYVVSRINGAEAVLHLDSGASATALTVRFAEQNAALVAGLPRGTRRIAGAGGAIEQPIAWWSPARVAIADRTTEMPRVQVVLDRGPVKRESKIGTLGQDVLGAFDYWAVDFRTMTFELGPPTS